MNPTTTRPKGITRYVETAFGILPRTKLIEFEAEGIAKGLSWVIVQAEKRPPITTKLLLDLHRHCFGFIFPWAGTLRQVEVEVSQHHPPPPHRLREELVNFERDLYQRLINTPEDRKEREKLLVGVGAWMQHRLVWIHPFLDYNGRIARLATNLLFLEFGLPLVEIPAEKSGRIRIDYLKAMQAGDRGNLRPLQKLLGQALKNT